MRILHTSDWHLGCSVHGADRTHQQVEMLNQLKTIVHNEKPDLFLLCGDVFDVAQPSATIQTIYTNAIVEIHKANPSMTIVITAGNHDSGTRHEIFSTPWKVLNVYNIGNIDKEHPENHLIDIPCKGTIVAVPFCHPRNLPDGFYKQVMELAQTRNTDNLPIILTAHTTICGCDFMGHSNGTEKTVGGIDSCPVEDFGNNYDYLALGHIHKGQFIHTGKHNVRYSGAPLAVSFDEQFSHTITIVDIESHGAQPQIRQIDIADSKPLVTLPKEGFQNFENTLELLRNYPSDIPAYIRLNVMVKDALPTNALFTAQEIAKEKKCEVCFINPRRENGTEHFGRTMTIEEFKQETPLNLAKRYANDTDKEFSTELEDLFNQALQEIEAEERNK